MDNQTEIWENVVGYEEYYQVSNFGRVKSLRRRSKTNSILCAASDKGGYIMVSLTKNKIAKTRTVHRLVAKAFIPNPDNLPEVNHIDGNRKNNNLYNLEWCTKSQNILHSWRIGKRKCYFKGLLGKDSVNSKLVYQYSMDGELVNEFYGVCVASMETGISRQCIYHCISKLRRKTGGFVWSYEKLSKEEIKIKLKSKCRKQEKITA